MGVTIKLNSDSELTEEKLQQFSALCSTFLQQGIIGIFSMNIHITQYNSFKISVSTSFIPPYVDFHGLRAFNLFFDKAVIRFLYDLFYLVLSDMSFFPELGNTTGKVNISTLRTDNGLLFDIPVNYEDDIYFDQTRKELHDFIYTIAKQFIILHEAYHILNGHTSYLLYKGNELYEEGQFNSLSPLDSQTLEMDADSCAFAALLKILINPLNRHLIPGFLQSEERILDCLVFVATNLFMCLPFNRVANVNDFLKSSHPNAAMRLDICFDVGFIVLERKPELLSFYKESIKKYYNETIANLINKSIIPVEYTLSDIINMNTKEAEEHRIMILKNWNKWIPLLTEFAYVKLTPPLND